MKTKDDSAYAVISVCGDVALRSSSFDETVAAPDEAAVSCAGSGAGGSAAGDAGEMWAL